MPPPRTPAAMVAAALEMAPELLPHAAELLADHDALGSDPEAIAEALATAGIGPTARVVDLGCGKGAVAIAIAKRCGCSVVGLDLHLPFVEHARDRITTLGLADRCSVAHHDVAKATDAFGQFDAAVFAALGTVLGPFDDTVACIRDWVRPGGVLVIADVFLGDATAPRFAGFEDYTDHVGTVQRLTAAGDELVAEYIAGDEDEDDNEEEHQALRALHGRVMALSERHPALATALHTFFEEQVAQNRYATRSLQDAIWVLRRRGD